MVPLTPLRLKEVWQKFEKFVMTAAETTNDDMEEIYEFIKEYHHLRELAREAGLEVIKTEDDGPKELLRDTALEELC